MDLELVKVARTLGLLQPWTSLSRGTLAVCKFLLTSASLYYARAFDSVCTTNCGKSLKRWEYQATLPASFETCMQVKKQQLELDVE